VRYAIDSARAQTYPALEIIVVDDGSTDNTSDVLALYGDKITVITQKNSGTAVARNTGVAASKGEYLAWLDSDDAWLPQKIQAQVDAIERCPEAAVVYTRCNPMDENGEPKSPTEPIEIPEPVLRRDILAMMVVESEVLTPSVLVRRSALDRVGLFDPEYSAEDWELNFRLARRYPFVYLDAPLTRHRIHDETKTKDRWPHALGLLKLRHKIEAARDEILAKDSSPAMVQAYERHRIKYAEAYYRVGKLALDRGDTDMAREMLDKALQLNPRVFKFYTRFWRAGLISLLHRQVEEPSSKI
jgi:glycosyltransferase involved in cell wall biosynthesis